MPDVTTNLARRTYLTANLGFGDGELIVQQKLHHSKQLGLAIGDITARSSTRFVLRREIAPAISGQNSSFVDTSL